MDRRSFLLTSLAGAVAAPLAAGAGAPRVGVLLTAATQVAALNDLRAGLRDLGYVEGDTIVLDVLSAEGKLERLPALARQLVARPVDLIVTSGPPAIAAARAATATIPIVMGRMDDVDGHGFVSTLARPGGNITGLSFQTGELAGKWVDLLKEAVPRLSRLAVLWDATGTARQRKSAADAASRLGLHAEVLEVRGSAGVEHAIAAARTARSDAVVILASPALTAAERELVALVARSRLPAIYYSRSFAEAGGLLSYGPTAAEFGWRQSAAFVDRILKGTRPGELPIQQPTKFELVINLKTAKALGLTIPPSLLARADQVIE
jgi:putative ABC transport system substrate-binding protein